jgi:hypothetical protein
MKRFACFWLFLSFAAFSHAAAIATFISASPFTLDGHSVDTPGVTSFPLVVGDVLVTPIGPAVLFFQDGSRVKLAVHSSIRLAGATTKPKLVLLSGSLDFKLVPGSILAVTNRDLERKEDQKPLTLIAKPLPVRVLPPERAMLAALDTPAPVVTSPAPHVPAAIAANPTFLIPGSGAGGASLATALVRLPPLSRRF